jgi:hypothetical protein
MQVSGVSRKSDGPPSRTVKGMTTLETTAGDLPEVLSAEPAVLTGALVGYARVSTNAQFRHRHVRRALTHPQPGTDPGIAGVIGTSPPPCAASPRRA